jgi:hypothetical protein
MLFGSIVKAIGRMRRCTQGVGSGQTGDQQKLANRESAAPAIFGSPA